MLVVLRRGVRWQRCPWPSLLHLGERAFGGTYAGNTELGSGATPNPLSGLRRGARPSPCLDSPTSSEGAGQRPTEPAAQPSPRRQQDSCRAGAMQRDCSSAPRSSILTGGEAPLHEDPCSYAEAGHGFGGSLSTSESPPVYETSASFSRLPAGLGERRELPNAGVLRARRAQAGPHTACPHRAASWPVAGSSGEGGLVPCWPGWRSPLCWGPLREQECDMASVASRRSPRLGRPEPPALRLRVVAAWEVSRGGI